MPLFAIPILIILALFAVTAGGDLIKSIDLSLLDFRLFPEKTEEQAAAPQPAARPPSIIRQAPSGIPPPFSLDTAITQGPEDGELISDTNMVTFEFEGSVVPADTAGRITFETRIAGVDSDWRATSSRQRTVTLPAGEGEYIFEVRSKLSGETDTTPATRTFSVEISPSFGKVIIGSFRRATSSSPFLITLSLKLGAGETLSISNWRLQSNAGGFAIRYGAKRIFAQGTPFQDPIVLQRGDRILISGAASPFGSGGNFKPNACFGYLQQYYTFPLSVSSSCPDKPSLQDVSFLKPTCQDFILKDINFSRCEIPAFAQNPEIAADAQCVSYLNTNFTYDACVALHSQDSDFLKNEWQIFADRSFGHPTHDTIRLLDENGLFVDRKVY